MANIQPYEQRVTAQGSLSARATPDDFGAQVARADAAAAESSGAIYRGLAGVGQGMMNVSMALQQAENDNGKLWAAQAASDLQIGAQKDLAKASESADPRDPDFKNFASNFTNGFDERAAEVLQKAPNQVASRALQYHMASLRDSVYGNAAKIQSGLFGEYTKELAQKGISASSELIMANPTNENFEMVRSRQVQTVRSMETNGLNKLKYEDDTNNALGKAQVLSAVANNSQGFLTSLRLQGVAITPTGPKGGVPTQAPTAQEVAAGKPTIANDEFSALAAQAGLTGAGLTLARAFHGQESGYGKADTSKPNYAGAIGPMQVIQKTFDGLKKDGSIPANADFNNQRDTTYAGLVLLKQLYDKYNGDVDKIAAVYYSGPKAVNKDGSINYGYRDLANDKAPTVGGYIAQLRGRMGVSDPGKEVASAPAAVVQPASESQILSANSALEGWKYLTAEQKIQFVRMAEANVGRQNAGDRAELERQIKDRMAMLSEGRVPGDMAAPQFSRANMIAKFGPDAGGRAADAWEYQSKISVAMSQVQTMTPAQIAATAATLEPQGADGFIEKSRSYNAFLKAAEQMDTARQKAPMEWAIQNKINGVQPLPFNDFGKMTEELKRRGTAAVNIATNYQAEPQILTKGEADAFTQHLDKLAPAAKISMLESARLAFGTDTQGTALFQRFSQQISEKTPIVGNVGNLSVKQGLVNGESASVVGTKILEGEYILRGKKLDDPTQTSRPMAIDQKVENVIRTNFNIEMGKAFRNLDGQYGFKAQTEMYQMVKNYLAADAYHKGGDLSGITPDDVKKAVTAVSGGVYKRNDDALMAPWGYPMQKFQDEFNPRAQAALNAAGVNIELNAFRFDNAGDGKYVFRNGSGYLTGPDGKAVTVDFNKPFPTLQAAAKPETISDLRARNYNQGEWGKRPDGTNKGTGFLGVLQRPDGGVMTEFSIGVNLNGKEMDIPVLVPTLTRSEVKKLLSMGDNDRIPDAIVDKAVAFAKKRISAGKPVFAQNGEQTDLGAR